VEIADMAIFPWLRTHERMQLDIAELPCVEEWRDRMSARPVVARGIEAGKDLAKSHTMVEGARRHLFGQRTPVARN
jgi:GST-like protein